VKEREFPTMADISGPVTYVMNQNTTTPSQDLGCAIVHDTASNQDEAITFWNGTQGLQNNRRIYFNDMFCTALASGKPVSVTTTGDVSGVVESVSISSS
jgi:hypothetical protein